MEIFTRSLKVDNMDDDNGLRKRRSRTLTGRPTPYAHLAIRHESPGNTFERHIAHHKLLIFFNYPTLKLSSVLSLSRFFPREAGCFLSCTTYA